MSRPRLKYRHLEPGVQPQGDVILVDGRGRVAELHDRTDMVDVLTVELAAGRTAHLADKAKRFASFAIMQPDRGAYIVVCGSDCAAFATIDAAVGHGINRNGPFRLLSYVNDYRRTNCKTHP